MKIEAFTQKLVGTNVVCAIKSYPFSEELAPERRTQLTNELCRLHKILRSYFIRGDFENEKLLSVLIDLAKLEFLVSLYEKKGINLTAYRWFYWELTAGLRKTAGELEDLLK